MSDFLKALQTNSAKVHSKSQKMQKVMARLSAESKRGRWSLQCSVDSLTNDDKESLLALGVSVVYRSAEQIYIISWRERNRPQFYQPANAGTAVVIPAKVDAEIP